MVLRQRRRSRRRRQGLNDQKPRLRPGFSFSARFDQPQLLGSRLICVGGPAGGLISFASSRRRPGSRDGRAPAKDAVKTPAEALAFAGATRAAKPIIARRSALPFAIPVVSNIWMVMVMVTAGQACRRRTRPAAHKASARTLLPGHPRDDLSSTPFKMPCPHAAPPRLGMRGKSVPEPGHRPSLVGKALRRHAFLVTANKRACRLLRGACVDPATAPVALTPGRP